MRFKGSKTEKNLYKTFANKSRNYTRYILFSEKARIDGYRWIQREFEILAEHELAHAREAYGAYLHLLGRTENNIQECMYIEENERKQFYELFEREAKEEGFDDIVPYFNGLSQICNNHSRKLKTLEGNMKIDLSKDKKVKWMCMNCGFIYEVFSNNTVCPVCKYTRGYYKPCD